MTGSRKIVTAAFGLGILCLLIFGILLLPKASASSTTYITDTSITTTTTPSPFASPSPLPPASKIVVAHALKQRRLAIRAWKKWNHARWCFGLKPILFGRHSARRPSRLASDAVWLAAGKAWHQDAHLYRHKFKVLWYEMNHPHGNAWERWRPLVRWVWPSSLVNTVICIIRAESSGSEFRYNTGGSGAYGLMQLLPRPSGVTYAYEQLVYAYWHKYVAAGYSFSPWASSGAW